MECRGEQKPRPEDPEQSPLGVEVAEHRPRHNREHEQAGQVTGGKWPRENGFDDGEQPFVCPPVLRIGGQARPECASRLRIGKMEEDQHDRERSRQAYAVAADERRKGGDRRELGEGREGERDAHGPRSQSAPDGEHARWTAVIPAWGGCGQGEEEEEDEQKDAERLEVSAPGRLDHHQR